MADEPFALADRVAACLLSLTPSAVHRANRRLTQSHNFLTYEDDLRTLLQFHQDVRVFTFEPVEDIRVHHHDDITNRIPVG